MKFKKGASSIFRYGAENQKSYWNEGGIELGFWNTHPI